MPFSSGIQLDDQIMEKLNSLNSHCYITGTVSKNIYIKLLNTVEKSKKCDPETALELIKFCDSRLIDLVPKERQILLNNLFDNFLPGLNVNYNQQHYESYIKSTISNRNAFDVFKISHEMNAKNILTSLKTNSFFMKMLCESGEINVALLHLKYLIESETIRLFDLNTYKNQKANSQELYEAILHSLNLRSNQANNSLNINLFNPIFSYYFSTNNTEKAIKIFDHLSIINIKPNNTTRFNMIKGYIGLEKFEKAAELFENFKTQLFTTDKLSLFSILDRNRDELFLKKIFFSIPNHFEMSFSERIHFISEINYLCERKLFEKAYFFVQTFFVNEITENDPIRRDLIELKINVVDYFCKSLVLNLSDEKESVDILTRYASLLDKDNLSTCPHLLRMIYHSYYALNVESTLELIHQLKSKGIRIKLNHVLPLIKKEANQLEIKISCMKTEENYNKEDLDEYKSLISLLGRIQKLGCRFEKMEIRAFLDCLKRDSDNNCKSFLTFYDLFKILKSSNIVVNETAIFYECAYKLLRHIDDFLEKNDEDIDAIRLDLQEVGTIRLDLQDFHDLVKDMRKDTIDQALQKDFFKLLKSLITFIDSETHDYKNDVFFKVAKLLNEKGVDSIYKKLTYDLLLSHFSELFKTDFKKKQEFQYYLRNNFESRFINKKLSIELMGKYNSYSIAELEKILETEPKKNFPLLRVLLIKMVNPKSRNKFNIDRIEEVIKELPDEELTPMVCENLQNFYAHISKPRKSKFYFWKMIEIKGEESDYTVNSSRLVFFVEKQFKRRKFTHEIIEIFNKLNDKKMLVPVENKSQDCMQLKKFLIENVYPSSIPDEFKTLVETIFQSNFIQRDSTLTNFVMQKLLENQKFEEALKYYKFNLIENKQSVLEILFLSHLLSHEKTYMNQVNQLINYFDKSLANNALFLSFLMNRNFDAAAEIFSKKLDCQLDLQVLERLVHQCSCFRQSLYSDQLKNILTFLNQNYPKIWEDAKRIIENK